jgi:hypothetical protein
VSTGFATLRTRSTLHYENWQTTVKYSTIRNGTLHFLSFQNIWSTSDVLENGWPSITYLELDIGITSSVAHCETREIIEIFHRFRPIVQIFYTRAVHTVRSAQNLSHSSSSPSVCFSASSSYQSPARRRRNTSDTTSQQRRYSTESTLHCRWHKSAPNSKGLTAP